MSRNPELFKRRLFEEMVPPSDHEKLLQDANIKLYYSKIFDENMPGHILIDSGKTMQTIEKYIATGNLQEALAFFDGNNVPELEQEYNGISGRKAFKKILEIVGMPVPDEMKSV